MDIFERQTIERDLTEHGCPGVMVKIRQLSTGDLQKLKDDPTDDAVQALLLVHVEAVSGLMAGEEAIEDMARLLELADAQEAVPGPVSAILRGIGAELILVSSMSGADSGNSQPLSDSAQAGSDGTAPNA